MVPPVYALMQDMARGLGLVALGLPDRVIELIVLGVIFLTGGVLLPAALMLAAGQLTRALTGTVRKYSLRHTVTAFAPAFVPVGFGIWAAHYMFHFAVGALAIIPVFHGFLIDHYVTIFGTTPDWTLGGIEDFAVVGLIQMIALVGGFLWSMIIAQRVALRLYRRQGMMALLPWALLIVALAAAAVWIFSLPMEMRGTILFD
jgi:hypothetical protein